MYWKLCITEKKKIHYESISWWYNDIDWLDFIVRNRRGEFDTWKFDVVEGGVANDRVIDTVEAYMSNLMPLETALQNLAQHRPNNQICIRSQNVLDKYLHFIESYNI